MILSEMKTYVMSCKGFLRKHLESFTCPSFQTTIHQGQPVQGFEQHGQAGVSAYGSGVGTRYL